MKSGFRNTIAAVIALAAAEVSAQTFNVQSGSVLFAYPSAMTGIMDFNSGTSFDIDGRKFAVPDIDRIFVDDSKVEDNIVEVSYNESGATVRVAGNVARYIEATVSGANVSIT